MRFLLVAPGPRHSTYDVFRYWNDALGRTDGVEELHAFAYHDALQYHRKALQAYYGDVDTDPRRRSMVVTRASRELLLDVWTRDPDVVLIVDGSQIPLGVFEQIVAFRESSRRTFRIVVHVTESPHLDLLVEDRLRLADWVLVNDRGSAQGFEARLPGRVEYWPAAYSRDVHYPPSPRRDVYDVYFCGTIFPERARLFSGVDWGDWTVRLVGPWSRAGGNWAESLGTRAIDEHRSNAEVARDYRRARAVLNVHRTSTFVGGEESVAAPPAWSIGPRTVEAAACGAFQVSDARPEMRAVFGDSIPVFEGPDQLLAVLRSHVSDPELRSAKAEDALRKMRGRSFDDRARRLIELLEEERESSASSTSRQSLARTSTATKVKA